MIGAFLVLTYLRFPIQEHEQRSEFLAKAIILLTIILIIGVVAVQVMMETGLKIKLKVGERLIKQGVVSYSLDYLGGRGRAKLCLTNQRILIVAWGFLRKKEFEIPLSKVIMVKEALFSVRIVYREDRKTKHLLIIPWKFWRYKDWREEIGKAIRLAEKI
jgi:hypothetical protein